MTQREMILEIRGDLRAVRSAVDVLVSQDLNKRVTVLEALSNKVLGAGLLLKTAFGTSVLAGVLSILSILRVI